MLKTAPDDIKVTRKRPREKMTILRMTALLLLLSVPLAACGIKPKSVEAPQGADKDTFPRTYPTK
jgi:predicted small lipoprotein YifL